MYMSYELVAPSDLDEEQQKQIGNLEMNVGAMKGALDDDDKKAIAEFPGKYFFRGPLYLGRVDLSKSADEVAAQFVQIMNDAGQVENV